MSVGGRSGFLAGGGLGSGRRLIAILWLLRLGSARMRGLIRCCIYLGPADAQVGEDRACARTVGRSREDQSLQCYAYLVEDLTVSGLMKY